MLMMVKGRSGVQCKSKERLQSRECVLSVPECFTGSANALNKGFRKIYSTAVCTRTFDRVC